MSSMANFIDKSNNIFGIEPLFLLINSCNILEKRDHLAPETDINNISVLILESPFFVSIFCSWNNNYL